MLISRSLTCRAVKQSLRKRLPFYTAKGAPGGSSSALRVSSICCSATVSTSTVEAANAASGQLFLCFFSGLNSLSLFPLRICRGQPWLSSDDPTPIPSTPRFGVRILVESAPRRPLFTATEAAVGNVGGLPQVNIWRSRLSHW